MSATSHPRTPAFDRRDGLRILVIEDDDASTEFLRVGLSYEGCRVTTARDGRTGLRLATPGDYSLVILDLMLPDLDGFTVCERLRARDANLPIIMLTARTEIPDRVAGLNLGADDYLTKPFSFEELVARIGAVLRRRSIADEPIILQAAGLTLNPETREVARGDVALDLTPTEFALLEHFLRHPRRVFSRETLRHRIWGADAPSDTNVVDVHVANLRAKLGDETRRLIRAVYGMGYVFRPDDDERLD